MLEIKFLIKTLLIDKILIYITLSLIFYELKNHFSRFNLHQAHQYLLF